jgi:peptide/nickel transport system substrate-binding protein
LLIIHNSLFFTLPPCLFSFQFFGAVDRVTAPIDEGGKMLSKHRNALAMLLALVLALAGCQQAMSEVPVEEPGLEAAATEPAPEEEAASAEESAGASTAGTGAWVDEVVVVEEPSAAAAVTRLDVGELDVYAYAVSEPDVFQTVQSSSELTYIQSFGSYNELTFNPVGPVFESTGKLNPFAVPAIREAMNWLIDRNYIVQEIFGGLAIPKFFPITASFPDYARLIDVVRPLEIQYAHDPERAQQIITTEMEGLGAELVDGQWQFNGEPVELIFLIRTEDERREIGDYVASLLEDQGFTVMRDYRTSAEASPVWSQGDPADGLWHLYTGGWVTTAVDRDQATNFDFFYTARGLSSPLWLAYTPAEEFDQVAETLSTSNFQTQEERAELFAQALELAMHDSVRVWLADRLSFSPYRADVTVAADLAGGIYGSWLWPFTLKKGAEAGGTANIAMPAILNEPWNPIAGSNFIYDTMLIRGTGDQDVLPDPYTGLFWPQRIERAEVTAKEGLPIVKTLDWVDLSFAAQIDVPADAWVDWDASAQRFISVGDQHPDGLTANIKSVVYYPADFFDIQWHDGSTMSMADIVMGFIQIFDRAKPESAIYDEAAVPDYENFIQTFRGMRIAQTDPLVIEWYSDQWFMDAEWNIAGLFPYYPQTGPGAWHTIGMGMLADENRELAFSADKAEQLEVEWMSFIAGPSLEILARYLEQAAGEGYIPYAPTLGEYISAEEVEARWQNLQNWYNDKGHFWVGTGAFLLEEAFPVEGTVQLSRNPAYPDPADKWERFETPMIATTEIDGAGRVTIGAEATFDVFVDFGQEPYPMDQIQEVKYLVFDAQGELASTGVATAVDDGLWQIVLSAEDTAQLEAGANRLEVAVIPIPVSIPSLVSMEFVTVP